MEIPYCPVIRPTMKQFQNFREFVERLDRLYKKDYGIVRIIPPPEWKARKSDYQEALKHLHIYGPIEQNLYGKGGVYECLHIAKKSMSYHEYKTKAVDLDHITQQMSPEEVEQSFWKNIAFSPPLYGADLLNSLMEPCSGGWDLKSLDSVLSNALNHSIKGVNSPYCYVGQWKSLFCWHKQDLDLSAINFVHKGKSKFWYGVRSDLGPILEKEIGRLFPQHFSRCSQFLRHKTTLVNPYILKRKNPQLIIHKAEQKQGQFIIAFGGAYHTGFNFGYNLAEAVNYATLDWLTQMPIYKPCLCLKSNVQASPIEIYKNLLKSPLTKTKQFQAFQEYIFKLVEAQQQQQDDDEQTKKAIISQFSKKLKKKEEIPSSFKYKGEKYEVDNWVECEKCKIWRIVDHKTGSKSFTCKKVGKKCSVKEKTPKNYFTIG